MRPRGWSGPWLPLEAAACIKQLDDALVSSVTVTVAVTVVTVSVWLLSRGADPRADALHVSDSSVCVSTAAILQLLLDAGSDNWPTAAAQAVESTGIGP